MDESWRGGSTESQSRSQKSICQGPRSGATASEQLTTEGLSESGNQELHLLSREVKGIEGTAGPGSPVGFFRAKPTGVLRTLLKKTRQGKQEPGLEGQVRWRLGSDPILPFSPFLHQPLPQRCLR